MCGTAGIDPENGDALAPTISADLRNPVARIDGARRFTFPASNAGLQPLISSSFVKV